MLRVCDCVWFFCLNRLCVLPGLLRCCEVCVLFVCLLCVCACVCLCVCLCVLVCFMWLCGLFETYRVLLYGMFKLWVLIVVCCPCECIGVVCVFLREVVWCVFRVWVVCVRLRL